MVSYSPYSAGGHIEITALVTAIILLLLPVSTKALMTSCSNQKKNWIVRPSNANDKESVEDILRLSYTDILSNDYEEELLETVLPLLCCTRTELLTSGTWYVAEDPDTSKIVGCGGWTPKSPLGEAIPHLRHFATDPSQLRKGVARAIWDRTWEDWCEFSRDSKERPKMEVFSTITAESFYASLGFEKVSDITIPIGFACQFPAVLMRRSGN